MTISTTYAPVQYTGNAVTTAFAFPYPFFDNTDLLIYLDGVLQASGYTITGGSGASGTVTFSSAPASGVIVTISLSLPYTQFDNYVENQAFPADTLERGLDKAAIRDQQLNNRLNRALVFPDTLTGALSGQLPQPEDGKLLSWSGVLGRIVNVTIGAIANLTTVFTGLSANDFLVYNGTNWVNRKHLAKKGTAIASATTTDIGAADSDFIDVTGTTTITSLGATTTRDHVWVNFTGALTLTHNATSLILPSGASIITAAGDVAEFVRVSGSNWKCVAYQRADGNSVIGVPDGSITYVKLASAAIASSAEIIAGTASKIVSAANFTAGLRGLERYTLLATQTASNAPQIDFTSLITSTYDTYIVEIQDVIPVTDATNLLLRTSANNGTSYDSGASDYTRSGRLNFSGSTVITSLNAVTATSIAIGDSIGNASGEGFSGTVKLFNPLGTTVNKLIKFDGSYTNSTPELADVNGTGRRSSNAAYNAIRFMMSSGNISSGVFRLYGVRNT